GAMATPYLSGGMLTLLDKSCQYYFYKSSLRLSQNLVADRHHRLTLQARHQPKILRDQRKHMCIIDGSTDDHAVQQDPFIMRADLFCDADTLFIPHGYHDLCPDDPAQLKSIACSQFRGLSGNPCALAQCADPVAQIAIVIDGMDMTQTASAQNISS